MRDGGRTDEYAPDSDLASQSPGAWYPAGNGKFRNICINDFVDLDQSIPLDPLWGSSFQVTGLYPTQIEVRMCDPITDLYYLALVDVSLVKRDYMEMPLMSMPPEGAVVYGN